MSLDQNIKKLLDQALSMQKQGQIKEALGIYRQILQNNPRQFETLQLIAVIAAEQGNYQDAVDFYSLALQVHPNHYFALYQKGLAYKALGNVVKAIDSFSSAIKVNSKSIDAYKNRAYLYLDQGHFSSALTDLSRCIELEPTNSSLWCDQGVVYQRLEQFVEAQKSYRRALVLDQKNAIALNNLGSLCIDLGRVEEAIECLSLANSINTKYADASYNLGRAYHQGLMQLDKALANYSKARSLNPQLKKIEWNESLCHLALGNYEQGWQDYESRWQLADLPKQFFRDFTQPLWLGKEDLKGKTILLHAEQGLGDALQFCRYVPMVSALGAKVHLEVQESMVSLLKSLKGVEHIYARGQSLPPTDFHCPLMSLPLAFKTTLQTIPVQIPYLTADRLKVEHWANRLATRQNPSQLKVGLVWSGGVRPDQRLEDASWGQRRNISLDQIASLNLSNIDFFSLQKGNPAQEELVRRCSEVWPSPNLFNYVDELTDFSDTAALVENLDLIIAVDTSVVHLAGALGKPVWIMSRFDSCWRWLLERADSPWYPSARLYRQKTPGDWGSVLAQVRQDLVGLKW
jgi:tetratricopeptide (TPR) repeat protein